MKEYGKEESWVKLYTFSGANISGILRQVRPVVYSKDKRRLLLDVDGSWFGWYDIEKNKFKRIMAVGIPATPLPFESWTSVDSLVSLNKEEGKSKGGIVIKKVKAHGTPAPSRIIETGINVDSLVSFPKDEVKSKGETLRVKVKAHETPDPPEIIKTLTEVDSLVSVHKEEIKSKGVTATEKKGKHSVSKEQVKQDAHSVGRTSHNQGDDFNLRVSTQISSRMCSDSAINNLSKDFLLRLTGDATDRT